MSKDYIGPFGPEQAEAAFRRFLHHAPAPYMARVSEFTRKEVDKGLLRAADEQADSDNLAAFVDVLAAAVGALDREALVEKAARVLQSREHDFDYTLEEHRPDAAAVIEALFPTEPEVQDGR